jgi:phage regulator Rha-like protein
MELSVIQSKIYEIRGTKVMMDFDLAEMYQVETRILNQAVKRNINRFPEDFMFQLTPKEWGYMSSQIVMTYPAKRPKSATPQVFTEHGVTMLSSTLRSEKAVTISIQIVRAFVAMRKYLTELSTTSQEIADLKERVKAMEVQGEENLKAINDLSEESQKEFDDIYLALSELAAKQKKIAQTSSIPKRIIGFGKQKEEQ